MTITENVRNMMTAAMKAKDKKSRDFYAYVLGELEASRKAKQTAANPNPVLSTQEEIDVMAALSNKTKKAITDTKEKTKNITDEKKLAELQAFFDDKETEVAFYAEFLPKQMTEDEINAAIMTAYNNIPDDTHTSVNKGVIMKHLMPMVKGKADGKLVSTLVDKFIANL